MTTNINTGLVFEFVQSCRRAGNICEVSYAQHCPEDPALSFYKQGMGFPVQYIPTKVQLNSVVERFIRWRYPHKYYRLTGHY